MTYDHIRKTRAYGGIRISWDLGNRDKIRNKGLRKRMTEYVRRDFDVIVAGDDDQLFQRLNNADGSAVTVRLVSNDAQLDQAITNQAQVIGVEGTITAATQKTPLISIAVTGGIYQFLGDMEIRLSDFGKFSYANDVLFSLNRGVYSFRDLSFLSLNPNKASAISNLAQIEEVLVDNCQFKNATIALTGFDYDSSKIVITNNAFNLDSITTSRRPLLFTLAQTAPASLNIALIQGNSFTTDLMNTGTSFIIISTISTTNDAFSGNIQVGDIIQNTFLCKEAQLKEVRGIAVINEKLFTISPVDQNITIRSISNNTFEFLATGNKEKCRVINLINLGGSDFSTQSIYVQNMNSNLIKIQNYTKARGIEFLLGQTSDFAKQSIQVDHILHNDITYDGADSHGVIIFSGFPASTSKDNTVVVGQNGGFFDNHFHTTPTTGFVDIFIKNLNADPSNTIDVFVHDGGKGLSEANGDADVATEGPNINITP
ncbi:MAG: hypothetical protein K940chlam8_00251 [Chlamydiae bacterium]|nr:hypothetical protein [Chlamydiota bacterium]